MSDFFHLVFSAVNFIPSTLFMLVVFYWLVVIFGVFGIDFLDFDVEVEPEIDVEIDTDVEGNTASDLLVLNKVLSYFNLGKVPFMVFLTFLSFPMWVFSLLINNAIGNTSFLLSLLLLIPIFIVSLFFAKIFTIPFIKIFTALEKDDEADEIVGGVGTVRIGATASRKGQADVMVGSSFFTIYIKTHETAETAQKGEKVLILDYIEEKGYYLVEKYNV